MLATFHFVLRPKALGTPLNGMGLRRHFARLMDTFDFSAHCEVLETPKMAVVTLPPRPLVRHRCFSPPLRSIQNPTNDRVYVATRPTCGPPLSLSPAPKHWEPPRATVT